MTGGHFRLNHTGVVVSDLDRSIAFYREHFGAEVQHRVDGAGGQEGVARLHGMSEADFDLAHLQIGGARLELLQYRRPSGAGSVATGSDLGAAHIALETGDLAGAYARLTTAGIAFHAPPLTMPNGLQLVFLLDPDGNEIELMQLPDSPET